MATEADIINNQKACEETKLYLEKREVVDQALDAVEAHLEAERKLKNFQHAEQKAMQTGVQNSKYEARDSELRCTDCYEAKSDADRYGYKPLETGDLCVVCGVCVWRLCSG